ncbi:class II aldolase/adducin family protein [Salinigranum salinum]|uniref:class II aldolase/adducin family protein n=1 Tax=Salinigranum salinum TaxID=1364937 RepID=UPI0012607C4A|nr:class II aldolase/adducin family protein [Salinigranum salinum]
MSGERPLGSERRAVSQLGPELLEQDLTRGSGGNVSVRNGDRFAISPSGISYEEITSEMVPVVDLEGTLVSGEYEPSNEMPMHRLIYEHRDDVGGVVHTHSPYASTFASLGEAIPASHYLIAYAGKEIPVAGYEPPGTEALGELAVDALGADHDACLLQNHGVIAVGEDGAAALETAVMVEYCARIHYQASAIGDPVIMDDDDLEYLLEMFGTYRQKGK